MRRFMLNKNFIIGLIIISFLLIISLIGIFYTPFPPNDVYSEFKLMPPSFKFLLGTDNYGRDILSRLMKGMQVAFLTGFVCVSIGLFIGVTIGVISGYYGGIIDIIVSRVTDLLMAFPTILLALMFAAIFGGGLKNSILIIGIMNIPRFSRLARASFMQNKKMEYVSSAKLKGATDFRIIFIHILPNIKSSLIVNSAFTFSLSILSEAGLNYLGLGIMPPDPSLGMMLKDSQMYLGQAPWYTVFTGIVIVLIVLGFNLLGDGINEVDQEK